MMSDSILEAYIRQFIQSSPGPMVHFVWHGGEPTLAGIKFYERVIDLQEQYCPPEFQCVNNIQTNGILLDRSWCTFLFDAKFHVGISLDGPGRLHDKFRISQGGDSSHNLAMTGFYNLREAGIDPDVLCSVNAVNSQFPQETYRFFLRHNVSWLQFIPIVVRLSNNTVSRQSVDAISYGNFLKAIFDEWIRYDMTSIAIQLFLECLRVWIGESPNLCVMADKCGQVLALEHDGSVYSCDHFVDRRHLLGQIDTSELGDMIALSAQVEFGLAKTSTLPLSCITCPVLMACNGGCPKDRFALSADGTADLNYLCAGYKDFLLHILPYMEQLAALISKGERPSSFMNTLKATEGEDRAKWRHANRNGPCLCGSGKKLKKCCLSVRRECNS